MPGKASAQDCWPAGEALTLHACLLQAGAPWGAGREVTACLDYHRKTSKLLTSSQSLRRSAEHHCCLMQAYVHAQSGGEQELMQVLAQGTLMRLAL